MLERFGHGGDVWTAEEAFGRSREQFIDFSANMNPFGPPAIVKEIMHQCWQDMARYPDPIVRELRGKLAEVYGVPMESILVGNGAAELIDLTVRILQPRMTGLARPSFSEYEEAIAKTSGGVYEIPTYARHGFELQMDDVLQAMQHSDLLFLGNPNNPTGRLISSSLLRQIISSEKPLIVDEAFIDFVPNEEKASLIREAAVTKNLFVIRSMTKFYAIPGIRLGFIVAHPEAIARLQQLQVHWSVNYLAQLIGKAVLDDGEYAAKTKDWLRTEHAWLTAELQAMGLTVFPSDTNFILFSFSKESGVDVKIMQQRLGLRGILIRDASLFKGLDASYCRIAVRLRADNERLLAELRQGGAGHG
jgi:threonine-phosphate decarboxylase